jgi:hypothetical protein
MARAAPQRASTADGGLGVGGLDPSRPAAADTRMPHSLQCGMHMSRRGWGFAAVIVAACLVVVFQAMGGCNRASDAPAPWFTGEYIDPSHSAGTVSLNVREDGTFTLHVSPHTASAGDSEAREIGRGSWKSLGDGVELDGGSWAAALVTDDIRVMLPGRSDTLQGLRWKVTRGPAPVDSAGFVPYREFADFVTPPGGSGSSGGGL